MTKKRGLQPTIEVDLVDFNLEDILGLSSEEPTMIMDKEELKRLVDEERRIAQGHKKPTMRSMPTVWLEKATTK